MRVFLGGTCNGSDWRERLIPMLSERVTWFNPVVTCWDDEACQRELRERANADYCLYVLTPMTEGFYGIAELVDDSNKRPQRVVFVPLFDDGGSLFSEHQAKSVEKIMEMVRANGSLTFGSLEDAASFFNAESAQSGQESPR